MKQEIQKMFENAVHIGHRTQKWNPRMKKFIYGEKNGIHVINLEKTYECLEKALEFISKTVNEGRVILFASTKPQSIKLIEDTAKHANMPYVVSKWIPGLLTNFSTMKVRIRYMLNLKEQHAAGEFEKYTKKEASGMKKEIDKLQVSLGGVEFLKDLPDAVFIVDAVRDAIVVKEARKLKIPVIAVVDTNADPTTIDYPIPANDDALKSLTYILGRVKAALSRKSSSSKDKK